MRGEAYGTRMRAQARGAMRSDAALWCAGRDGGDVRIACQFGKAVLFGAAAFFLCFALLSGLMAYVKRRQKQQGDELDD